LGSIADFSALNREKVDALAIVQQEEFIALNASIKDTIQSLLENPLVLQKDLDEQTQTVLQHDTAEHEKTRATIFATSEDKKETAEDCILEKLSYADLWDRRQAIHKAHESTFRWILLKQPPMEKASWNSLVDWLQHGTGVYWINGKAGSGKSTLMRYIVDNPRTIKYLKEWSKRIPVSKESFFFWNGGSSEQRSYTGLLRSLLFETLQNHQEFIPLVFPEECAQCTTQKGRLKLRNQKWTLEVLKRAFSRLTSLPSNQLRFSFFIDGLDEYEGDHEDMAEFLKALALSPNIKICVSSRPWLVFEDAFRSLPGLRLQDLTFDDIKNYVANELEAHHRMRKLSLREPTHARELVHEIVTKADGVFLWVRLVVRGLLNGLMNRDGISDLRMRLHALPSELSALYKHMLNFVEPLYQEQASRTFRIYQAMIERKQHVSALELEAAITATRDLAIATKIGPVSDEDIKDRCEQVDAHLKSRCAGLLEVQGHRSLTLDGVEGRVRYALKVAYLHRTVKEFLESEDVQAEMLRHTTAQEDFEPNIAILMSYIIRLKQSLVYISAPERGADFTDNEIWSSIKLALWYAKAGDGKSSSVELLDELDHVGQHWAKECPIRSSMAHWSDFRRRREQQGNFLTLAVSLGLLSYVAAKLEEDITLLWRGACGRSLINYAILPETRQQIVNVEMIDLLLSLGAEPNRVFEGHTPWQRALSWVHQVDWRPTPEFSTSELVMRSWVDAFKVLLRHGANPNTTCIFNHRICQAGKLVSTQSHKVLDVIHDVFEPRLPREVAALQRVLEDLGGLNATRVVPNDYIRENRDSNFRKKRERNAHKSDRQAKRSRSNTAWAKRPHS
jgi:hypothetical protein